MWLRACLQWNPALRPRRYNDHSFDPNVRITELFYDFKDLVITTRILWPNGGRINEVPLYFKSSVTHTDKIESLFST